ncbi:hypothetical protein BaRGS_00038791 [Batillaria attramentaria]|uniref:Uncharacterized protein n=1 Tax=Batillaria attramentaria TaxID=370345 RepID=A0ABD0J540_9CAEN
MEQVANLDREGKQTPETGDARKQIVAEPVHKAIVQRMVGVTDKERREKSILFSLHALCNFAPYSHHPVLLTPDMKLTPQIPIILAVHRYNLELQTSHCLCFLPRPSIQLLTPRGPQSNTEPQQETAKSHKSKELQPKENRAGDRFSIINKTRVQLTIGVAITRQVGENKTAGTQSLYNF